MPVIRFESQLVKFLGYFGKNYHSAYRVNFLRPIIRDTMGHLVDE